MLLTMILYAAKYVSLHSRPDRPEERCEGLPGPHSGFAALTEVFELAVVVMVAALVAVAIAPVVVVVVVVVAVVVVAVVVAAVAVVVVAAVVAVVVEGVVVVVMVAIVDARKVEKWTGRACGCACSHVSAGPSLSLPSACCHRTQI